MSQAHIDRVLADFDTGWFEGCALASLSSLGLSHAALINLSDEFTFLPEGSYCPVSDVPDDLPVWGVGVHVQGDRVCVLIDNGLCAVCWLLRK